MRRLRMDPDRAAEPESVGTGQSGSYVVHLRSSSNQPFTGIAEVKKGGMPS